MTWLDRLQDLWRRLQQYNPLEVGVELIVIGIVVYAVIRFVSGTRAAGALKGLLAILVVATVIARLVGGEAFVRLGYLYEGAVALVAIAMIVVFQPELRRALIRLGEAPFLRGGRGSAAAISDEIVPACAYLSKARFGALIVVERQHGLRGLLEGGTDLNAELTSRLLQTIFFPGSALHDLAVVIRGNKIAAAGVQLPLADPEDMPDPQLGSRHRAAVGLTKESDALVVVVSEETGAIRLAERGRLSTPLTTDELTKMLTNKLGRPNGRTASAEDVEAEEEAESRRSGDAEQAELRAEMRESMAKEPMAKEPSSKEEARKSA